MKPFFSDKTPNNNLTLVEGNKIVSDNRACAEIFNTYYSDLVNINRELFTKKTNLTTPVENIMPKFPNQPSILKIKERGLQANRFSFLFVSETDVCIVIRNVNSSKAYQKENIPPKVLKENTDVLSRFLKDDINLNIDKGKFPDNLKNADITPIFKKTSP